MWCTSRRSQCTEMYHTRTLKLQAIHPTQVFTLRASADLPSVHNLALGCKQSGRTGQANTQCDDPGSNSPTKVCGCQFASEGRITLSYFKCANKKYGGNLFMRCNRHGYTPHVTANPHKRANGRKKEYLRLHLGGMFP